MTHEQINAALRQPDIARDVYPTRYVHPDNRQPHPFMAAAYGTACCNTPDLLYVDQRSSDCLSCGAAIDWQDQTIARS
jgi:hypothetical protein